ncbi:Flowering time control protein FY [Senna tora]|uniref:Flowering time control protein FY n=1 Tax=Senna tora TaxID=362788 RepID=A0A834TMS6_9FABA|nr:Flowering time control protein FY [Senna tora]
MQGGINQMGPPVPQGHFVGMNQMHSGSLPTSGGPPVGGFPNNMHNMQGPSNAGYPQGGSFNRPQGGQMPLMQGYAPYQSGNQPGMPPNAQQGPPPHSQTHQ